MIRVGIGYDVHRFAKGRRLVLGGVHIDCEYGLDGVSDADVLIHAVMDALLGAAALGDIGRHFPPDDEQYKNIDSCLLLEKVVNLLSRNGWVVGNIDTVIVADKPKLSQFIPFMRGNISRICRVGEEDVSVKATTEEGLGLAGNGIGAHCIVCLHKHTFFRNKY
jgi:2-C-methyl-D-erythritol 2,4-cyclodiphosphate synthase